MPVCLSVFSGQLVRKRRQRRRRRKRRDAELPKGLGSSWTHHVVPRGRTPGAAQGWRTHITLGSRYLGCPPRWAFSAVLEGHGGAQASLLGARHLPGHVLEALGPAPGEPQGVCRALRFASPF